MFNQESTQLEPPTDGSQNTGDLITEAFQHPVLLTISVPSGETLLSMILGPCSQVLLPGSLDTEQPYTVKVSRKEL